jgi:uncharacterized membrane protein
MQWLRRRFITGFFVTVPLFITVATFVWVFSRVDGLIEPFYERMLGQRVPGLGIATTVVAVLLVGVFATNVVGRQLLLRVDGYLLRVPVFKTIYAPVKQLIVAFSPDNEFGFKRVVMLEGNSGYALGFLTKEFTVDRGQGLQPLVAVYVPTNHLYLGDIVIVERGRVTFPDISVEEGLRIFLTGGMALPDGIRESSDEHTKEFRV